MGEDELLQTGQISETVVKGLDKGLFESLGGIGPLQVQKPAQGSHAPATGTLFELPDKPIEPFIMPEQGLFLHTGPFVGSLPVKRRVMSEISSWEDCLCNVSCRLPWITSLTVFREILRILLIRLMPNSLLTKTYDGLLALLGNHRTS